MLRADILKLDVRALANGSFERTIFPKKDTECEYFSPAVLAKLDAMLLLT